MNTELKKQQILENLRRSEAPEPRWEPSRPARETMHDYYGPHLIAQTTDYDVYSKLPPKTNEFSWLLVDSDGNARWNGGHLNRQSRLSVLNQIRERFGVS